MLSAREAALAAERRDVRGRWLLSAPALLIILLAAIGPLFVMLLYSFLEKGDYLKLDNLTLGYTFTPKNRKLVENLRVYLAAKNIFTLTGYKGNDPSIVTSTGITPGVDSNSAYPTATQMSIGITMKFH